MKKSLLFVAAVDVLSIGLLHAAAPAAPAPAISAGELAAKLDAVGQGSASIRTQLEIRTNGGGKHVRQLQIKQRRTKDATDLAYLVIWPIDQKGKGVILHQKAGEVPTGLVIEPPNKVRALKASEMGDGLFESDLAYQDAVENFFAWKEQALVGTETIDNVSCQILESKPGSSAQTIYGKVRSWIDLRRMVPMRVEKFSPSVELIRRIDTDRVAPDDQHRQIPARLIVHGPRKTTVTELNGSGIKHDVNFSDADFTPQAVAR